MKIKTSEATGIVLDWMVCVSAGLFAAYPKVRKNFKKMWAGNSSYFLHPSTDWSQGGPIIEREKITLSDTPTGWVAGYNGTLNVFGPTPLITACRCYVASKLGEEVEVPEELCV